MANNQENTTATNKALAEQVRAKLSHLRDAPLDDPHLKRDLLKIMYDANRVHDIGALKELHTLLQRVVTHSLPQTISEHDLIVKILTLVR